MSRGRGRCRSTSTSKSKIKSKCFWPEKQIFGPPTPIWPCVVTQGTHLHLFGPKNQYLISFQASKGFFGSQKAHIGIQKGPTYCWVISTYRLTPIWSSVVTRGTHLHLFWPKNQYLINFWTSKGPFWTQKAHIGIHKGPTHCWVISTDRLTPTQPSVVTKGTVRTFFGPKISWISFSASKGPFGSHSLLGNQD